MANRILTLAVISTLGWMMGGRAVNVAASTTVAKPGAPYLIDAWDTEDGLPQNSVIAMTQTRDGYLWLGTLRGLARFDGIRFKVYNDNNTPGLNSSQIVSIFEDSQSNLWIGTELAGVALAGRGRVQSLDIGRGGREGRLMSACEDTEGSVWLYTASGELCRHRQGKVRVWKMGSDFFSRCRTIIAEQSGPLWVGTDRWQSAIWPSEARETKDLPAQTVMPATKLDFLLASRAGGYWRLADGRIQRWRRDQMERDYGPYRWNPVATPVTSACEDREGNLVVGTLGAGVFWFDAQGKASGISTNEGLSHDYVLSLLVDREGTLWVGTDGGGLNRVRRQVFEVLEQSLGLTVLSASTDNPGGLWMGFNAIDPGAFGAARWKDGRFQPYGIREGLLNLSVPSVFVDRDQRVWAGTLGGLFRLEGDRFRQAAGTESIHPTVQAIHQDRQGRLWIGTQGGLVSWDGTNRTWLTTRDGLTANKIRAIADDAEGNLWVGTEGGGLNRLNAGKPPVASYRKSAQGLPGDSVNSLLADAEGVLWVGTSGGLGRLHREAWTRYTVLEGLTTDNIGYLVEDGLGYLWIGSSAGLMRAPKKALNDFAAGNVKFIPCRAFGRADGLPTGECTQGSQPGACRAPDGRLWFPTIKGLAHVDPQQLNPNPHPPPVVIEVVLVEGEPQGTNLLRAPLPQTVTVPPGRRRVEIEYTSLNLAAPEKARFRYRLEGHETDWIDAGNIRVARYSKLPPGDYRFVVTACNEDGIWNETGNTLAVIVLPPFWRTWWFLTGAALVLLGTIVAVVHYISTQKLQRQVQALQQQEALERERKRIARDMHDQLGASLTQLSLLGEMAESDKDLPEEVGQHARQISQTARETTRVLDEIVWAVNPSNDTLEGLINYICKYAPEYLGTAGLRYRQEVPNHLPAATLPPDVRHNVYLAATEAITNIVRHAKATEARLRLRLPPGAFVLEIQDNGRGPGGAREKAAESRNGLRNMRKRMEEIGGSFALEPGPEGGTVVRLTAPLRGTRPAGG